jgi:hypothetical protein
VEWIILEKLPSLSDANRSSGSSSGRSSFLVGCLWRALDFLVACVKDMRPGSVNKLSGPGKNKCLVRGERRLRGKSAKGRRCVPDTSFEGLAEEGFVGDVERDVLADDAGEEVAEFRGSRGRRNDMAATVHNGTF